MKILIIGLSGSGKTTLADSLNTKFNFYRINADVLRTKWDDWDFSLEGRIRQAYRIKFISDTVDNCIIDFIAPLEVQRVIIEPSYTIWMNTVKESKYKDTDALFSKPKNPDKIITTFDYDVSEIANDIRKIKL